MLILVAGVSALLAALAVAFLARMRLAADESLGEVRETQARLMLVAACHYVQEASRLGYDDPLLAGSTPPSARPTTHHEAFGWIDVRDGAVGPRDETRTARFSPALVEDSDGDGAADRPAWPAIGGVVRAPMHVLERPPFAIRPTMAYNPIESDPGKPEFGMPYLRNPDPLPETDAVADYWRGVPQPRADSAGMAWFRCYRDGAATFVVTCGAGGSLGFRDWGEVVGAGAQDSFGGDRVAFEQLVADEERTWYRIEWSGASADAIYHGLENDLGRSVQENYILYPMNSSHTTAFTCSRSRSYPCNPVGTIRWVQRLLAAPTKW